MESILASFRDVLTNLSRTDHDPRVRRRAQCLVVRCASESNSQAARLVEVSGKSIQRWTDRFLVCGRDGLADRPRPGRPHKLDSEAEAFIERVLGELPTQYGYATATWTLADMRDVLAGHGWDVSLATVDRTLHGLGYRYRRPRHDLDHRQDADAVATAKQTLAVLQKKGVITQAEFDSCISTSVICTPTPTWQRSGSQGGFRAPSRPPVSISASPSSVPWNTAREQ